MQINSRVQLVELMKHLNLPLTAVEVGVAEGRLSRELIDKGIELLYLVDVWDTVPFIDGCASFDKEWHNANYENVNFLLSKEIENQSVILLKGFSYKMAEYIRDESLGLVYIDCAHDYNSVRSDINSYYPKLVKGGILAFHDFGNPAYGVSRAVHDFTKGVGIHELPEDGKLENMGAYIIKE